jgi:ADP-heptose:LPS heptosyltransferase
MPCAPHKIDGRTCDACDVYAPMRERVLIVKLGAMGDVLRTTALLGDIVRAHDAPRVTWLTESDSVALLAGNPAIDEVVDARDAAQLAGRTFDCVYALDNDRTGLGLAHAAHATTHRGFVAGPFGTCVGVAPGGDPTLFDIGLWDDRKRANDRSYLEMLAASAGLRYGGARPTVVRDADADAYASATAGSLPRPIVGVNADASGRWERKRWNAAYVERLVEMAARDGFGVMLFGGPALSQRNRELARRYPGVAVAYDSSGDPTRLIAGVALCGVLLTGDTLAMHVAWGLGIPVVALFGPTSSAEIDLAPSDRKLAATDLDCLGCYLKTCSVDPHCMDRLVPETVYDVVRSAIAG